MDGILREAPPDYQLIQVHAEGGRQGREGLANPRVFFLLGGAKVPGSLLIFFAGNLSALHGGGCGGGGRPRS